MQSCMHLYLHHLGIQVDICIIIIYLNEQVSIEAGFCCRRGFLTKIASRANCQGYRGWTRDHVKYFLAMTRPVYRQWSPTNNSDQRLTVFPASE